MKTRRRSSLWFRVAWPFALFVVVGGVGLAGWMQMLAEHESQAVFSALARTNADFLRSARIPESEQMMGYLGRLLNLQAFLSPRPGETRPALPPALVPHAEALARLPANEAAQRLGAQWEAIAAPLGGEARLLLVRPAEPALQFLRRPDFPAVLGIFCLLTVVLAGIVSRHIVRTERLALLGRLATGLAHEIHNPLSTIRLHSQLLESAPPADLPATAAAAGPVLVEESGRIEALVNQWMFLARPEPPAMGAVALEPVVARMLRNCAAQAAHARVKIEAAIPAELRVRADERRLVQALGNLVLNAIQAMPRGGVLRIAARRRESSVEIAITDSGAGFSPAALLRHRELFFSEKEGGMGIGLSVAAEVLEAHGGRLEVANEAGGGATVRAYLTAAETHS